MSQTLSQLIVSKQLPRIICKWIIITFGLIVLILNLFLLKYGMDSILYYELFDKNSKNMYRFIKSLLVITILFINCIVALGIVGVRNKNFWMSTIFTLTLCLFLIIHILGTLCSVTIDFTERMKWKIFGDSYSVWLLIVHCFITIVSIIHNIILWRDEKLKSIKAIITYQNSA